MKLLVIISGLVCFGLLSSCVSQKKYRAAVDASLTNEQAYQRCEKERSELQASLSKEQLNSRQELLARQKELDEKERMLKENSKNLADMNELVSEQRQALQNLKKEVCDALKCFTPDELTIEVREGKLYVSLSDKLLFPSGSDVVNARGKEAIAMLSQVLASSSLEIMVEGHTDNVPISNSRNKDNWDLSVHRATSVARLMIDNGIASERIISSGRGEYHPLEENKSSEGRQRNRRTEIVLAPKLDKLWKLTEDGTSALSESESGR
jgi:chemotaxis protein MotB